MYHSHWLYPPISYRKNRFFRMRTSYTYFKETI